MLLGPKTGLNAEKKSLVAVYPCSGYGEDFVLALPVGNKGSCANILVHLKIIECFEMINCFFFQVIFLTVFILVCNHLKL